MRGVVVALVLLVAVSTAYAQPSMTPPDTGAPPASWSMPQPMPPGMTEPVPVVSQKSVGTAMAMSIGATAAGFAMTYAGGQSNSAALTGVGLVAFLAGPSFGHIYAGHTWSAGLGVRIAGTVAVGAGIVMLSGCLFAQPAGDYQGGNSGTCSAAPVVATAGAIAIVGGAVLDLATTPSIVHRANQEAAAARGFTVTSMKAMNGTVPGIAYGGRF